MKTKKLILLIFIALAICHNSFAQLVVKGKPVFFDEFKNEIPEIKLPPIKINRSELKKEKSESRNKVLKFAENIFYKIDFTNQALCIINKDADKTYYLKIRSEGAYSLGLQFEKFYLPKGARLFVYSADKQHVRGAFTSINNKTNKLFAIAPVKGDEIIIEYHESTDNMEPGELVIESVSHDYLNVFKYLDSKSHLFGKSGECNVNINCEEDALWQKLKHSVCKITYSGKLCSGVLINNTSNSGEPYLLTANHCINNNIDAQFAVFYFNYESPTCENQDGNESQSIAVSELIATPPYKSIDFSLLKLSISPPPEYKPYYAGWNRDIQNPTHVTSIHHPLGDVKKISHSYDGALVSDYGEGYSEFTHWWIDSWDTGTTEDGSSGSPLFNEEGLIIGDLSGGDANCAFNFNDYYQQFSASWNHFPDSSYQLKCWLDSINTGTLSLSGYQPYDTFPTNLRASTTDTIINLYWNVPIDSASVEKYYIYRNAILLDSTPEFYYSDTTALKNTIYSYWISAKFISPIIYESNSSNIVTIKTMDPILIPFTENFESGAKLPNYWFQEKLGSTDEWVFKQGGFIGLLDTAYEGTTNAYFYGTTGDKSRLILPRLNFNTINNALLSFYVHIQDDFNSVNQLNILYKQKDSLNWNLIRSYNKKTTNWEKKTIPLPNLSENYQIAFEGFGTSGYGIAIDSVRVYEDLNFINPDIIISNDTICISDSTIFSTSTSETHEILWQFGPEAIPSQVSGSGPHKVKFVTQGVKYAKLSIDNTYIKDSVDILNVIEVPKPSFTQNGNVLISNLNYGNQWFLDGEPILNATMQNYTILEDGTYYVEVTNSLGCSNISQSEFLVVDDIPSPNDFDNTKVKVYPNPNSGNFTIDIPNNESIYNYSLYDITGRLCLSGTINSQEQTQVLNTSLYDGIYFLTLSSKNGLVTKKLIIKK